MISTKYMNITDDQLAKQKKILHSALFWLLIYKDPETCDKYKYVDVDKYISGLMLRIGGMNELFGYPAELVTLLSVLQAIKDENLKSEFDYHIYRKLVLDAHSLIDKIGGEPNV